MPTLEIDGIGKVKIDDADWNNLNNQGKQELVNRIAREGTTPEPKEQSTAESLVGGGRTGLQGLTLGFGDELEAGLRTGFGLLGDYDETVGDIRKNIKDFRRENPALALGLEVGGGLLTGKYASSISDRLLLFFNQRHVSVSFFFLLQTKKLYIPYF